MLALHDVRHAYDSHPVLDIAAMEEPQGSRLLVLGPSGSGKTTLLHVLAGVLRPDAGRVVVAGQDLYALSEHERDPFRGRHLGLVFQRLHLLTALTIAQNLRLAPALAGLPVEETRVREVLAALDLAEKADVYPHELSVGQQQRVAIGRAVMNRPRVLLADEPTAALDDRRAEAVLSLLLTQAEAYGATLVVATHDRRIMGAFDTRLVLDEVTA